VPIAVERIVRRAVETHALRCGVAAVESWAAAWLSGADRTEQAAARAAVAAAVAAVAAWAAANAAARAADAWAADAAAREELELQLADILAATKE
jgi:hypothetical protein